MSTDELNAIKLGHAAVKVEPLLLQRWSPRAFSSQEVSGTDLRALFTAASWAASSVNEQPWRFIFGRKGYAAWEKIFSALTPKVQSWAAAAPVLYASFAKKTFTTMPGTNTVAVHDTGAASANLSLQATALGLTTHGLASFDGASLQTSFGVPEDFEPVACWVIGYPGDPETLASPFKEMEVKPRVRKTLDQFVFSAWDVPAEL